MREARHSRLSGLDQSFLHFETPNAYMHVALTAIFAPGSLSTADHGIDFASLRSHVASRLHLIPRYRQRLHYGPLVGEPVWVDDDAFDLDYHVRHSHLPAPGTDAQLKTLVARLLERPLDRRRPLWETTFIEGLSDGRFAMLTKIHHCLVDGIAGMDILAALLDPVPVTRIAPPEPWRPAPPPSGPALLVSEIRRRSAAAFAMAQQLPRVLAGGGAEIGARFGGILGLLRTGLRRVTTSPINREIGPHRRVEWVRFGLAEVKEIRRRLGGTVNDVVLGIVTGALQRLHHRTRAELDGTFRVLVPVSTRAGAERGETGNRVSAWIAELPLDEPDVLVRHRRICATTQALRGNQEAQNASLLVETAEWTPPIALAMSVQLLRRVRLFNLIVTNVPGPAFPLYLLDAPMIAGHPHVPLFDNQGLGVALLSYDGCLSLGLVADWDVVHDLAAVAAWVEASFHELREAAGVPAPEPAPSPAGEGATASPRLGVAARR